MPTIVCTVDLPDKARDAILELSSDITLRIAKERDAMMDAAPEAEIWFGGGMRPEIFKRCRRLKWIQVISAGVDRYMFRELLDSDVILTNVRGMHAETIADHVFMYMLAFSRNLLRHLENQRDREWDRSRTPRELAGQTLGIVGLGSIGQEIARRATSWGMRVLGVRRSGRPVEGVARVYKPDQLHEVLGLADFLVLCAPSTPETRGMMGRGQFRAMKKGSVFINVARGDMVDEDALLEALTTGHLAGAGLDVFATEPLPQSSPLWEIPQVIITPHLAGSQSDYVGRATELFLENLRLYLTGKPLKRVVDKKLGY